MPPGYFARRLAIVGALCFLVGGYCVRLAIPHYRSLHDTVMVTVFSVATPVVLVGGVWCIYRAIRLMSQDKE
jgi:hypothetical protein